MIKIDGSILNALHPRVKTELNRLNNELEASNLTISEQRTHLRAKDSRIRNLEKEKDVLVEQSCGCSESKLSSKIEELEAVLEGERHHCRSVQDDYRELLQDNTQLDLKNDELLEQNRELGLEIAHLKSVNETLIGKYAMKCKARAEACASVQNWTKLKFKIKGRFVYSTPKVIDETTVILDDIEKISIREVLERMFEAEGQVSELQAKLEKMTTQKESIWDIEEPWFEYQLQNRNKVLKIRYCENNMGKFVDSRIFENGHPTRKGLCISVNDFDEFSKYMQKTNTKVKKLSQWGY